MQKREENKLIPLRKFVSEGQYSSAYLSVLAGKKKLKTKKIGKLHFTTEKWFNEYLENHAQEAKAKLGCTIKPSSALIRYLNYKNTIEKPALNEHGFFSPEKATTPHCTSQKPPVRSDSSVRKLPIILQATAVFMAIILINFLSNLLIGIVFPAPEKGMVLGAEESATGSEMVFDIAGKKATTTRLIKK